MLNTIRILRDSKEIVNKILKMEGGEKQLLTLVLRFGSTIDKEEVRAKEFIPRLWEFLDSKHEMFTTKHKGRDLTSIVIQDQTGTILYDSNAFLANADRIRLKKQQDLRVKMFSQLSLEDKERTIDILEKQIQQNEVLPPSGMQEQKSDDNWDDFLRNL